MKNKRVDKTGRFLIAFFSIAAICLVVALVYFFLPDDGRGGNKLDGGNTVNLNINDSQTKIEGDIITPEQIDLEFTLKSLQNRLPFSNVISKIPPTGDSKLLIVPIIIPGYELSDYAKVSADLEKTFFGESNETYWESVSSYYQKSSYGQLNLEGRVMPWYDARNSGIQDANSINVSNVTRIISDALDYYDTSLSSSVADDYDSDKDGFIDSVWCVYSAPNYLVDGSLNDSYWAFTGWNENTNNSNFSVYGWASYEFMYYNYNLDESILDAHTFIHETGHMLGLNDYYNYDGTKPVAPMGFADMMDANIGDHSLYSKMLLGWIKPYILTNNVTISIAKDELDKFCLVIPYDSYEIPKNSNKYIFNPFDEYMFVEYYSPDNLNALDSEKAYINGVKNYSIGGFKVYHVDNRMFELVGLQNKVYIKEYSGNDETLLFYFISNSTGGDLGEKNMLKLYDIDNGRIDINDYFNEITLIDANNKYNYTRLHYTALGNPVMIPPNGNLFKSGDTFTFSHFKNYFVYGERKELNNGKSFTSNIMFI